MPINFSLKMDAEVYKDLLNYCSQIQIKEVARQILTC